MSNTDDLKKYLVKNPWPEKFYGRMQIDNLYSYKLSITLEQLWPYISDRSEVNRLLGFHEVSFEEKNGKIYGKGRLSSSSLEWEELPWEWESGREIKTFREFSKGFISYSRAHSFASQQNDGSLVLSVYTGWIPNNIAAYLIIKNREKKFQKEFKKNLYVFQSEHDGALSFNNSEGIDKYAISNSSDIYKAYEKKINPIRDYLIDHELESSLIYRLLNYVISPDDNKVYRIRPKVLAEKLDVETDRLITLMLHSGRCGLLDLSWDIICPYCRGVKEKHRHLNTINTNASCDTCKIDFSTGNTNAIEASFTVNQGIRKVERKVLCNAEINEKPHVLLQKVLYRGNTFTYTIPDINKKLRFRSSGKKSYGIIDVAENASLKNFYWDDLNTGQNLKCSPGSTIFINNTEAEKEQYIIEIIEDDKLALRPSELFNISAFRENFSDETIPDGLSIDIGLQNILMIDIADSTGYYKNLLNPETFLIIKKYFLKIKEIAGTYKGVIIKTSGESALLSFSSNLDALRCSIKLISFFNGTDKVIPVTARISLNRGPCIAVNLDKPIDYFGLTLNVTSKLINFTESGEISLTESFVEEESVSMYLKEKNYTFKNISSADIEGYGEILFRKIRIKKLQK